MYNVINDLIPYIRKCGVKTRGELAELVQSKPDDMPLQVAYQALVDIEKNVMSILLRLVIIVVCLIIILTTQSVFRRVW